MRGISLKYMSIFGILGNQMMSAISKKTYEIVHTKHIEKDTFVILKRNIL